MRTVEIDAKGCDVCGTCICVCPTNALTLGDLLEVSPERCTGCGRCVAICPFGALSLPAKAGGSHG